MHGRWPASGDEKRSIARSGKPFVDTKQHQRICGIVETGFWPRYRTDKAAGLLRGLSEIILCGERTFRWLWTGSVTWG
jgi:hypothetical protein